jgi:hypothetical protein
MKLSARPVIYFKPGEKMFNSFYTYYTLKIVTLYVNLGWRRPISNNAKTFIVRRKRTSEEGVANEMNVSTSVINLLLW